LDQEIKKIDLKEFEYFRRLIKME